MTVYNKLKIAILSIISTQSLYAITLDPVQIQSGTGELLYLEMKFSHADPNSRIDVSLADPEDLIAMGASHQPPGHLNFFTRRSADGSGVVVITSSRPVVESELNILVKIKEGNATHIQQIKMPLARSKVAANPVIASKNESLLNPQIIVSEKDIALNLPTSMRYTAAQNETTTQNNAVNSGLANAQTPLAISIVSPPRLENQAITADSTEKAQSVTALSQQNTTTSNSTLHPKPNKPDVSAAKINTAKTTPVKTEAKKSTDPKNTESNTHIVQANESLWKIASRIAAQTNQSVPQVMQTIKANNSHAFIQGNINRMRQGVALNLAVGDKAVQPRHKDIAPLAHRQSGKEKYKLGQAEMSLVTETKQDSAQGSANKETQLSQTSSELSLKVMTAREKTVKLQHNVSKLSLTLQQKDQRIQLLNARLAQLQQQLQQQNHAKKPTH